MQSAPEGTQKVSISDLITHHVGYPSSGSSPNQSSYQIKPSRPQILMPKQHSSWEGLKVLWTDFPEFREQLAYCYFRGEKKPSRLDSPMSRDCVEKEAQGGCEVAHATRTFNVYTSLGLLHV